MTALSAGQIVRMTPLEAIELQGRLVRADPEDARLWLLYCSWRKIKRDRGIPPRKRFPVFLELFGVLSEADIKIEVESRG